jgi:hypothetical protein
MVRLALLVAIIAAATGSASASNTSVRWFHSPSRNVSCELRVNSRLGTHAFCATLHPARCVRLEADGTTRAPQNCLLGVNDEFTLGYGRSVRLGPFRCTSRTVGMRCVELRSGHGFLIGRKRLRQF